jgi:hypothetical protein
MGAMLSWLKTEPMVAALIFCSYGASRPRTSAILRDLFEASFFLRSRGRQGFLPSHPTGKQANVRARKNPRCLTNPIGRAFSKPPLPYIHFMMTYHP